MFKRVTSVVTAIIGTSLLLTACSRPSDRVAVLVRRITSNKSDLIV
ncbi:TPA: hypothetical protein ACXOQZ_000922 [Bacillus anthracis]